MTLKIKTERLLIRNFREDDWQSIVSRSTQEDVAKYMAWDTSAWAEKEKVVGWIREQQTFDLGTFGKYVEFALELDGESIGVVGIKRTSRTNKVAEVGWDLGPAHWGQGYATEANGAFIDYCFRHLDLHRITSLCDVRNEGSWRLMERLGMRREAHHLESSFIKGEWVDDLVYAVLRSEWLERPGPDYEVLASSYASEMLISLLARRAAPL